ncbi:hypothetical protein [Microbacterium kyungheense]|uniref:hypothetical protein n=1 Tax=Microbacterium kyungheense TaxID=1263636 RepID=UPI0024822826|nr:hypothetical protein [Microbacterium kyungheense]
MDPALDTETLAEVVCEVRNERWAGVLFRLRSGKALGGKDGEIVVTFRKANHVPDGLVGAGSRFGAALLTGARTTWTSS